MAKAPQREHYKLMEDTPYITQARDVSTKGYEGFNKNYENVNVFSPETQASIQANANAVYKRAEDDFARNYNQTMRNLATRNYNQFGTLNATAPSYVTDMQNLQAQRALMDSAYNKALYAEQLKDQELARRYNTLNMYKTMYDYGQIPYQQDLMNYNTSLRNQDIDYQNAVANYNANPFNNNIVGSTLTSIAPFMPTFGTMANNLLGSASGKSGTTSNISPYIQQQAPSAVMQLTNTAPSVMGNALSSGITNYTQGDLANLLKLTSIK